MSFCSECWAFACLASLVDIHQIVMTKDSSSIHYRAIKVDLPKINVGILKNEL